MIKRFLKIGSWDVEFYFAVDGYDIDTLLERLYRYGASISSMKEAVALMEEEKPNTGFTFANPVEHFAIVAIGPTTNGSEFIDTLVHEIHHLAVSIAAELGVDLEAETPAYLSGDSARDLADVVCKLGCIHCNPTE